MVMTAFVGFSRRRGSWATCSLEAHTHVSRWTTHPPACSTHGCWTLAHTSFREMRGRLIWEAFQP